MHICKYLEPSSDTFCVRHSNDFPSEIIETKAKEELAAAQKQLNATIALTINDKTTRRQQATVKSLKSVLSPLRRVPLEILREIALLLPRDSPCHILTSDLWCFGRVCRKWRAVALSSKYLWTTVVIDTDIIFPEDMPTASESILIEYLQRSGDAPLYIRAKFDDLEVGDQLGLLEDLILHCHRWKTLHLTAPDKNFWRSMCQIGGRVPILEHVACYSLSVYPSRDLDFLLPVFSEAPRLHSVDALMDGPMPFLLPWHQLTHYRDDYYGLRSRHGLESQFFERCTRLRECILLSWLPTTSVSQSMLPDLTSLVLGSSQSLNTITAPALQFLMLYCVQPEEAAGMGFLSRFISRSSCSLTVLVLFGGTHPCHIRSDDLVPVLKASPRLTQLSVYDVYIQEYFLQCMTLSTSSDVVPLLENLTLDASSFTFSIHLLFSMLESRTMLQQVSIKGSDIMLVPHGLLFRYATLREKGFHLHFGSYDASEYNYLNKMKQLRDRDDYL